MFDFKKKNTSVYDYTETDIQKVFIRSCVRDNFKLWFEKGGVDIVASKPNNMRIFLLSKTNEWMPDKIEPLTPYSDFIHHYSHFGLNGYEWYIRTVPSDVWLSRGLGNIVDKMNIPIKLICKLERFNLSTVHRNLPIFHY